MTMRLPFVMPLVLLIVASSPLWIMPLLKVMILGMGAVVWIIVLLSESLGAW